MSDTTQTRMPDVFDKCATDGGYFGPQRAAGDHYLTRPVLPALPDRIMEFQGKDQIMWSVNNYLGLANHPDVIDVARTTLDQFGVSSPMGSRMMSGNSQHHLDFEAELARFTHKESAFLFNYGYMGVTGTISSLVGPDDIVVMDKLAHACIVDGSFMSQGQVRVFKHNNVESLESVLKRINRDRKGGVLVVIEGVYGMTGDLAKLDEISAVVHKYDARLFIDDAHGWGVMGDAGRGTADHFGVQDDVDIYFGTFAKAFASIGGFAAADKAVTEWILYNARTQVFAKSLPLIYVQTLRKTMDLVVAADDRRARLWEISNRLKDGLRNLGFFVGPGESPICSVFVPVGAENLEKVGIAAVSYLRDNGVFVTAITYPVIPLGLLMFRMIPTANHLEEDVDNTVRIFSQMRDAIGLNPTLSPDDAEKVRKVFGQ